MKIKWLGVGGAFCDSSQWQSSFIIEKGSKRLLIDCGGDIRHSLKESNVDIESIDSIYISHLHNDHCGGLEWLGFYKYFSNQKKPNLYIHPSLQYELWNTLKAGMGSMNGYNELPNTYFNLNPVIHFQWNNIGFDLVKSQHVINMPNYGLLIKDLSSNKQVYFSGDTSEYNKQYIEYADLVFHDCFTQGDVCPVHIPYNTLKYQVEKTGVDPNKIWMYHYEPASASYIEEDKNNTLNQFLVKGQEFELYS